MPDGPRGCTVFRQPQLLACSRRAHVISAARCPVMGENDRHGCTWGGPHLLSRPQTVVVGPRERLGKEPGEALLKKAGSHCERLQDAGAGRRAVRVPFATDPRSRCPATGQEGCGEGRRLGCRGPPSAVTTVEARAAFPPTLALTSVCFSTFSPYFDFQGARLPFPPTL